jgi:hypothetical protein
MSTLQSLSPADLPERAEFEYRPVPTSAVASVVFGLLSAMVFVGGRETFESALLMCPLPLIGLALGFGALRRIRANPEHLKGASTAAAGIALSALGLVGGLAYAGYVRATEVPEGYAPTSFAEMKPDEVEARGGEIIPKDVAALDGEKVFIKGYFRPDSSEFTNNVKHFLLVRDNNQCCFGDLSTVLYYDQVAVKMKGDLTVDYKPGVFRMGGKLFIKPENATNGTKLPVFILEADYAE